MANEKLTAARALPRALAREFFESKYLTLMVGGLIASFVMGLVGAVQSALSGGDMMLTILSGVMTLGVFYLCLRYAQMRQKQDSDSSRKAARASIIYFAVMACYLLFTASLYYSMHTVINGGEVEEITQDVVDQWNAMLPYYILTLVITLFQALAYLFLFRALGDVSELAKGRYPDRNAFSAASIFAALATGMSLCNAVVNVIIASGSFVNILISVLSALPELVFYFSAAQLTRQMAARRD